MSIVRYSFPNKRTLHNRVFPGPGDLLGCRIFWVVVGSVVPSPTIPGLISLPPVAEHTWGLLVHPPRSIRSYCLLLQLRPASPGVGSVSSLRSGNVGAGVNNDKGEWLRG